MRIDMEKFRFEGGKLHEKVSRYFTKLFFTKKSLSSGESKNSKVMFYFFKNVHIPILIPIYQELKKMHPDIDICFGYKSFDPRLRAGFSRKELGILKSYDEKMFINPSDSKADITFIADSVYDWIQGCGKIVNVGHGILSKGQYYLDTELARREEMADLVCVPGDYHKNALQNVISTPIVVTGMSKLDNLFNGSMARDIIEASLNQPNNNNKYILFAPTFNEELSAIPFVMENIINVIPSKNAKLLIKLHGSTRKDYFDMYEKLANRDDRIIFVKNLDITPLIFLADVMISDVSSAIIEFSAMDKPVVLFNSPKRHTYKNYDERSVEYKFRDIGVEVNNLDEMKAAVKQSLLNPSEYSGKRIEYTNLLVANKVEANACKSIIDESINMFLDIEKQLTQ
jgi:hypothetical protein